MTAPIHDFPRPALEANLLVLESLAIEPGTARHYAHTFYWLLQADQDRLGAWLELARLCIEPALFAEIQTILSPTNNPDQQMIHHVYSITSACYHRLKSGEL